jgi:hypothetical protein
MPTLGPAVDEIFARTTADPAAGAVELLARLVAVVGARETGTDRLFARYRGRPMGPACCVYRDDFLDKSHSRPQQGQTKL